MSLLITVKKVKLEKDNLFCVLDNKSISLYKKITKSSFLKDMKKIGEMDEEIILTLIACTLRFKPNGNPVGMSYLDKFNPIGLITELTPIIVDLIQDAMPNSEKGDFKKKISNPKK